MKRKIQLMKTRDGSHTLFSPNLDEHYHSMNGSIAESMHVFINAGFLHASLTGIKLLEIGFGTGLNALLTCQAAKRNKMKTEYHSIDNSPLPDAIIQQLNYPDLIAGSHEIFERIHNATWDKTVTIDNHFILKKINHDLLSYELWDTYDVVYFDAFGPDKQPEMWTNQVLAKIYQHMNPNGIFTTYSAKGEMKRRLRDVGFFTETLSGPPGKREMTRALKKE